MTEIAQRLALIAAARESTSEELADTFADRQPNAHGQLAANAGEPARQMLGARAAADIAALESAYSRSASALAQRETGPAPAVISDAEVATTSGQRLSTLADAQPRLPTRAAEGASLVGLSSLGASALAQRETGTAPAVISDAEVATTSGQRLSTMADAQPLFPTRAAERASFVGLSSLGASALAQRETGTAPAVILDAEVATTSGQRLSTSADAQPLFPTRAAERVSFVGLSSLGASALAQRETGTAPAVILDAEVATTSGQRLSTLAEGLPNILVRAGDVTKVLPEPRPDARSELRPDGLAGLNSSAPGSNASAASALPAQGSLTAPLSSPAWPTQLGQQLVMLGQRGGEQRVELHLNPAELGPLTVSLKVSDQGAQAQFLSAHATVRQALEQAIPQLREALAEQGISLGQTSVGEHRQQGQGDQGAFAGQAGTTGPATGPDENDPVGTVTALNASAQEAGRVDLYA
ncbi:flagellar hook-length control protein FliK [Halomonas sp.]|uniref:flagellar hook-length control protein FliK n=1 Tax=Halomonas sp. TaxID=1486246 RepID=UPI00384C0765